MSDELKTVIDKLGHSFEEFKKQNDARLDEIEKKGDASHELKSNVEKLEADVADLTEQKQKLEAAMQRPAGEGEEKAASDAELEHKEAFNKYLRGRITDGEIKAMEQKALSVGTDTEGGYLVTPEMSGIIATRVFESSPMRQIANVQTIGSDSLDIPVDYNEAGASWVGETASRSETTTPDIGKLNIPVHEMAANPRATQQFLDDANINVEGWLAGKIADKFMRTEATAFVTGNGVAKPKGILSQTTHDETSGDTFTHGSLGFIASGSSGAVVADRLITTVYSLKSQYLTNAKWLMARLTMSDVRQLKQDNKYIWQPGLAAGQPDTLLGYEVVAAEDMPAVAADSLSIAFGDFNAGYTIVDRVGIRTLRDPYSAKPYVQFYTTKRVGGDVVNFEAIKLYKLSA